jgi:hypothetical protein
LVRVEQQEAARRLGRSGQADRTQVYDSGWDFDVTNLIQFTDNKHSGIFESDQTRAFLADVLRGVDRGVLVQKYGAS